MSPFGHVFHACIESSRRGENQDSVELPWDRPIVQFGMAASFDTIGAFGANAMSRRPRFLLTNLPLHVVRRGNDRCTCFFQERDYRVYLEAL